MARALGKRRRKRTRGIEKKDDLKEQQDFALSVRLLFHWMLLRGFLREELCLFPLSLSAASKRFILLFFFLLSGHPAVSGVPSVLSQRWQMMGWLLKALLSSIDLHLGPEATISSRSSSSCRERSCTSRSAHGVGSCLPLCYLPLVLKFFTSMNRLASGTCVCVWSRKESGLN